MRIVPVSPENFQKIKYITQTTIRTVYPRYYPVGAVEYFCSHHSDDKIFSDIVSGNVFLLGDEVRSIGTVTIHENRINRLFVLPEYQHSGYGRVLLDFAEQTILAQYDTIMIDASLPAKQIYLKRGYRETEYHMIQTENGDFLCYDVMQLQKQESGGLP